LIVAAGLPTCILGSYAYTLLNARGASLVIGLALLILVPARRLLLRLHGRIGRPWLAAGGAAFGFIDGSTPGSGVVLISILLAAGLHGAAVVATDAGISVLLAVAKTTVFQTMGALTREDWLLALVIGAAGLPAAFLARRLVPKLPPGVHTYILDGVVVVGALVLVSRGLR
jgi:uncharacterized membrane protein YfcA